jgi:hypothetical protein
MGTLAILRPLLDDGFAARGWSRLRRLDAALAPMEHSAEIDAGSNPGGRERRADERHRRESEPEALEQERKNAAPPRIAAPVNDDVDDRLRRNAFRGRRS